jgi:hypothetical protein
LSSRIAGGFSRRAQLHGVSYGIVVAYFKNAYWHSNEGTKEDYEILDQDGLLGDQDYNLDPRIGSKTANHYSVMLDTGSIRYTE